MIEKNIWFTNWKEHIEKIVEKKTWKDLLIYTAELHIKCTNKATPPFLHSWEEIGTGYCYGPAFGHWDIVHQIMDSMRVNPVHVRHQIKNNLLLQQPNGLVPGSIWLGEEKINWSIDHGHPPVWPVAVQDYYELYQDHGLIEECYSSLIKQISWFDNHRKAEEKGYYYTDILNHQWESGVDEGIRFKEVATGPFTCIDATSHVFQLCKIAGDWGKLLGKKEAKSYSQKANILKNYICEKLFDSESGWFYDIWAVDTDNLNKQRHLSFEGIWPVVVGAATNNQAQRVIEDHLLNSDHFLSKHPIPTIAQNDPAFELKMWNGPVWNSMTYWAARGCMQYNCYNAALELLERALDASAEQFGRTGTIWEFYHPHGGSPKDLKRKPQTEYNTPCSDYLGHNPFIAMADLRKECLQKVDQ